MEKNQALVDLLKRIAGEKNATPAQIALAWLLAQKPWIVPIPGTTKLHRLEENLGAADVELTAQDLAEIERAASAIQVEGERYPEQLMATTGLSSDRGRSQHEQMSSLSSEPDRSARRSRGGSVQASTSCWPICARKTPMRPQRFWAMPAST